MRQPQTERELSAELHDYDLTPVQIQQLIDWRRKAGRDLRWNDPMAAIRRICPNVGLSSQLVAAGLLWDATYLVADAPRPEHPAAEVADEIEGELRYLEDTIRGRLDGQAFVDASGSIGRIRDELSRLRTL